MTEFCSPISQEAIGLPNLSDAALVTRCGKANARMHARDSRAYRMRLPLTAGCAITGLLLTILVFPATGVPFAARLTFQLAGVALVVSGVLVRLWSLASIGDRKSRELVTTGPYSLTRNPLYLGTMLSVLGGIAIWVSLPMMICLIPCLWLYRRFVVPTEERVLQSHFGSEFDAYCRRTPRWWPRVHGYVSERRLNCRSKGFRREEACGLCWVCLAFLSIGCQYFFRLL